MTYFEPLLSYLSIFVGIWPYPPSLFADSRIGGRLATRLLRCGITVSPINQLFLLVFSNVKLKSTFSCHYHSFTIIPAGACWWNGYWTVCNRALLMTMQFTTDCLLSDWSWCLTFNLPLCHIGMIPSTAQCEHSLWTTPNSCLISKVWIKYQHLSHLLCIMIFA